MSDAALCHAGKASHSRMISLGTRAFSSPKDKRGVCLGPCGSPGHPLVNRGYDAGAEAKPRLSVPARRDRATGRRVLSDEAVKHAGDHRSTNTEGRREAEGQVVVWGTAALSVLRVVMEGGYSAGEMKGVGGRAASSPDER